MGADTLRPLDTGGSKGISPGVLPTPIPVPSIPHGGQVSCWPTTDRGGDKISDLEASCGQDLPQAGTICEPVPKRDGSFCLVINLKPLNFFICKCHFKMGILRDLLQPSNWMCSIDLKDAYLSVSICLEHRHYLHFTWMGSMYEFTCLPFGLTSTPRVFIKLLKLVMAFLRGQGSLNWYPPTDQIPGLPGGLGHHEAIPSRGQAAADWPDVSESLISSESIPQEPFPVTGEDGGYCPAMLGRYFYKVIY